MTSCNLTCYKNVLIAVKAVARHYQRELSNHLPIVKSTIETLEQGVLCKVDKKDTRKMSNDIILVHLFLNLYIVLVNSIEFEQVSAG